jgi:hypothetical protein
LGDLLAVGIYMPFRVLEDNAGLLGLPDKGRTRHVSRDKEPSYVAFVHCKTPLSREKALSRDISTWNNVDGIVGRWRGVVSLEKAEQRKQTQS